MTPTRDEEWHSRISAANKRSMTCFWRLFHNRLELKRLWITFNKHIGLFWNLQFRNRKYSKRFSLLTSQMFWMIPTVLCSLHRITRCISNPSIKEWLVVVRYRVLEANKYMQYMHSFCQWKSLITNRSEVVIRNNKVVLEHQHQDYPPIKNVLAIRTL